MYTDPDATSQHAQSSQWACNLGDTAAYLNQEQILDAALAQNCTAIHPGYGFLSENAAFAQKCARAGIIFIGPPWKAIEDMGDKARSKVIMSEAGIPCVPGYHGENQSPEALSHEAERIGYPVLVKALRGGGGKGMRIVHNAADFAGMLRSARSEAMGSFGNDEVLVEKYITAPRHVEVQIFADKYGGCVALGERDCSIQRRHQKILEESPAPNLDSQTRKALWEKARAAALAVNYEGAGTVEFILDNDTNEFFFMEMNTRLQVEHPVTEMVTGLDLVHWQIMVAEGKPLPLTQEHVEHAIAAHGHAIEARIYAENPAKNFIPDSGRLLHVRLPDQGADVRVDSGFVEGDTVSSHYDPMISKLIVRSGTRREALRKLKSALEQYEVAGPVTNIEFLKQLCRSSDFVNGSVETGYIGKHGSDLFPSKIIREEILAVAAIASCFRSSVDNNMPSLLEQWTPAWHSFNAVPRTQNYHFQSAEEEPAIGATPKSYSIHLRQLSQESFSISSASSSDISQQWSCSANFDRVTSTLTLYTPTQRLDSCVIFSPTTQPASPSDSHIHIFNRGTHYRLRPATPTWLTSATGVAERPNSLLSPMPCKILRVDVQPGDMVEKDQPLLTIESMKMETVIRSPKAGLRVKKVTQGQGEVLGSGVELVEFEDLN